MDVPGPPKQLYQRPEVNPRATDIASLLTDDRRRSPAHIFVSDVSGLGQRGHEHAVYDRPASVESQRGQFVPDERRQSEPVRGRQPEC